MYDYVLTFGEEVRLQSDAIYIVLIILGPGRVRMAAKTELCKLSLTVTLC